MSLKNSRICDGFRNAHLTQWGGESFQTLKMKNKINQPKSALPH